MGDTVTPHETILRAAFDRANVARADELAKLREEVAVLRERLAALEANRPTSFQGRIEHKGKRK